MDHLTNPAFAIAFGINSTIDVFGSFTFIHCNVVERVAN